MIYSFYDDARSEISSSTISVGGPIRRQQRHSQPTEKHIRRGPRVKVVDRKSRMSLSHVKNKFDLPRCEGECICL